MYKLVNPNASKEAVALFNFLAENYGRKVISAQHTKTPAQTEIWHIRNVTGKLPAMCGFIKSFCVNFLLFFAYFLRLL